jgi:Raf kinase inhibitor-like YbhB/YbcL family protein
MKIIISILFIWLWGISMPSMAQHKLLLESPAFASNSTIPILYTCKGGDHSPPLAWQDAYGRDTQSFVLTVEDPDAPNGVWDHWVIYNIPPVIRQLAQDAGLPDNAQNGMNSWGVSGYRGPCPPKGKHRYIFTLYTLNIMLNIHSMPTKSEVLDAMQGHITGVAQLIGLFGS